MLTDQEIVALMDKYHMPKNIRAHCTMVTKVALFLAKKIDGADYETIRTAALLHDVVRIVDIADWQPKEGDIIAQKTFWKELREKYRGIHHEDLGALLLNEMGESKVATCIKKHRFLMILEEEYSIEEAIVYYSDKRVKHDEVVSLVDRFEDGKVRHGGGRTPEEKRIAEEARQKAYALEKKLCDLAGITPEDITQKSVATIQILSQQ